MTWILITQKQYPVFSRYWINQAFKEDQKKALGKGFSNYKSSYFGIYADQEELEQLKKLLITTLEKNNRNILTLCKQWETSCNNLIKYAKTLDKRYTDFSDRGLMILLDQAVANLRKPAGFIFLHHSLHKYLETWLEELLQEKNIPKNKRLEYFQILTTPSRRTKLAEAKMELEQIAKIVKQNGFKAAENKIKRYSDKYRWLGYDTDVGNDITIENTIKRIKNILLAKYKIPQQSAYDKKKIIKQLKLNENQKQLLNIVNALTYLASYRLECHMIAGSHLKPLLMKNAQRCNTTYELITQFTSEEIKKALVSKKLDLKEAQKRKNKSAVVMINGKIKVYGGDEVDKLEEKIDIPTNLKELKGLVVHQGNVKGRVKIVENKNDFAKIEQGNILVTKMTNPDFIAAIEKCAGIITDIGGITCHAAIISRELNKPCIIGTIYATKILKDGDVVELDTEKGIVRIV